MATIYVATSKGLTGWASDVGLTKHVYKIGITEEGANVAIEALNETHYGGQSDWKLAGKRDGIDADETTALARVSERERPVDPIYYPRLKNTSGIFKVKAANVESQLLVQQALKGQDPHLVKVKSADIAAYLLDLAAQG